MTLEDVLGGIKPASKAAAENARIRWNSIAKPLGSLGLLEEAVVKMAGIFGSERYSIGKKGIIVMCADNGVVDEGVTQTGSEVTAVVAGNFTRGRTSVNIMAARAGADVLPVDVGMLTDVEGVHSFKRCYGSKNMAKGPAMSLEEAEEAVIAGVHMVRIMKEQGYGLIGTGEMGIGNTTTSSAVASLLLNKEAAEVTGKGAGLSDEGLSKKISVIRQAIRVNSPNPEDPMDVVAKVGGFDIAGLIGVFLGGARYGIPIVIDGFIASVAALAAVRLSEYTADYMLASHISKEPAARMLLEELKLTPFIHCEMYVGEGTGAAAVLPLLDMAYGVYEGMSTFADIEIESYKPL